MKSFPIAILMGCYCVYRDHQLYAPGVKVPQRAVEPTPTAAKRNKPAIRPNEVGVQIREFHGDVELRAVYSLTPVQLGSLVRGEGIDSRKKCLVHVWKQQVNEGKCLVEKLRELDHPNMLRVLDVVKDNGRVSVVYENCQGSVLDLVKSRGPLTSLSLCIIKQVLAALRHCHARQFTIRNLSLAQVLFLSPSCSSFVHIKLLPFDDRATDTAAPEVGKSVATYAGDVYSAGIILAQMLFGEIDAKVIKNRLTRNSSRDWENVEPQAKDFILALTSADSAKRPSAADCFSHSWIASSQLLDFPVAEGGAVDSIRNLASSKPMSQLKQALLLLVFNQMYPEELTNEMQLAFQMLDLDMDGQVSGSEIQTLLLKRYSESVARGYFSAVLQATGMHANGRISFTEFLIRGCNRPLLVSYLALTPVFHILDREHRGRISSQRIKQVLRVRKEVDEDEEKVVWMKVMAEMTQADEGVSFNDFCTYLRAS